MNNVISAVPWAFSWVVENELAAMGWPQTISNLEYLVEQGIGHLVTLSPEKTPPIVAFTKLEWSQILVKEYEAPTLEQITNFIAICEKCLQKKQALGVHCKMGKGRTGVMVACYLVHFKSLSPQQAITTVRIKRPESIETIDQERAIIEYYNYLETTD